VALRIPTGAPETRHLEHRVAGADANPYLAIAAVLAGMHKGIVENLDPGPAITGNGYAQAAADLPNDWPAALRLLKTSALLKEYFGERFLEIFHAIKAAECRRFSAQVSELDFEWYLTRA
jgi:glutamine synthetase